MRSDIHKLVGEIYACVDDPALWQNVLPRIADALGGHAAALQHQKRTDAGIAMSFVSGLDSVWLERYMRNWDTINPWRRLGLAYGWSRPEHARYTAIHASRLIAPADYRKTAIFNECMRDADLYDCVSLPLFADDHPLWIAVFCGRRKDCFDANDIATARYLAAHICRAASISSRLAAKREESPPGARASPLIVVEDSKFVEANAAAQAEMHASGVMRAQSGKLLFGGAEISRRFGAFIAGDAARKTRGALCSVDIGDGQVVSFYRPPSNPGALRERVEYVLMFDRYGAGAGRTERCARALSMSVPDAELALLFAEGLSPEDVSRVCGGAAAAYRSRMAGIFAHLGVKDQGALVLRVLAATRSVGVLQAD